KVRGFEAGLQHFWDNGFGFRAQYTRNWSRSWVADEERPLEGIAPSVYSLGVMYEKGAWSLGATADRTDGFVTAINVLGAGFNEQADPDRKSTRLNSSHVKSSYAVFCLKKKHSQARAPQRHRVS